MSYELDIPFLEWSSLYMNKSQTLQMKKSRTLHMKWGTNSTYRHLGRRLHIWISHELYKWRNHEHYIWNEARTRHTVTWVGVSISESVTNFMNEEITNTTYEISHRLDIPSLECESLYINQSRTLWIKKSRTLRMKRVTNSTYRLLSVRLYIWISHEFCQWRSHKHYIWNESRTRHTVSWVVISIYESVTNSANEEVTNTTYEMSHELIIPSLEGTSGPSRDKCEGFDRLRLVVRTCVWHDSFTCMWHDLSTRVGHDSSIVWGMTHRYVGHDSSICGTWLIDMWDMTHSQESSMTPSRVWHMTPSQTTHVHTCRIYSRSHV